MTEDLSLKRTALYYPSIAIPSGPWLRQALLYWDQVASIVPPKWHFDGEFPPDIRYLMREGEFRGIYPDRVREWDSTEFFSIVETLDLRDSGGPALPIYSEKFNSHVLRSLVRRGLAQPAEKSGITYMVHEKVALTYMALLAKYLADTEMSVTVPSTDFPGYERLIYEAGPRAAGFPCFDVRWLDAIPIPSENASFPDIVAFKRRYRSELITFRDLITECYVSISEAKTAKEFAEIGVSLAERIQVGVANVSSMMQEARLASTTGCAKALLSAKSPALWAAAGVASGHLSNLANVPLEWSLGGIAVAGAIQVSARFVQGRNAERAILRESPFAYVYHAKREGLLAP